MKKLLFLFLLASSGAFADTIDWYGTLTGTLADGTNISGAFTIAITPQEYKDYLNGIAQLDAGAIQTGVLVNWPDVRVTVVSNYPLFTFGQILQGDNLPVVDLIGASTFSLDLAIYIDQLTGYTMLTDTVKATSGPFDVTEPQWLAGFCLLAWLILRNFSGKRRGNLA